MSQDQTYYLDIRPVWNPENNDIYFFRIAVPDGNRESATLSLNRLSLGDSQPQIIYSYPNFFPPLYLLASGQALDTPVALSPDTEKLAFTVMAASSDDPLSGLWVLDINNSELQQIVTVNDLWVGLPREQDQEAARVVSLEWTADGLGIVFGVQYPSQTMWSNNVLYVDVTTGHVIPIFDYSEWPNYEVVPERTVEGVPFPTNQYL
jgi:Tol biopolymer transport system component